MTSPFLEVMEKMIESKDDGSDADDEDNVDDNNGLQSTGENCDIHSAYPFVILVITTICDNSIITTGSRPLTGDSIYISGNVSSPF